MNSYLTSNNLKEMFAAMPWSGEKLTFRQMGALNAALGTCMQLKDREARLEVVGCILGHPIGSTKEIPFTIASELLDLKWKECPWIEGSPEYKEYISVYFHTLVYETEQEIIQKRDEAQMKAGQMSFFDLVEGK